MAVITDEYDEVEVASVSDDEDSDAEPVPVDSVVKSSARTTILSRWIASEIDTLTADKSRREQIENLESMQGLLSNQDNVKIDDPREYQIALYERAKKQNTIAVLDTGSGKTLIAVLLLQHVLDQEIERRAAGNPPKYAFFLVTATTLVFQQYCVLDCNLEHKVEKVCGSMGCNLWTKSEWAKILEGTMVVVCTAQVLYECLWHSYLTMEQISLLIFDEVHHAKQNHVYAQIIQEYYKRQADASRRPRIFGMTASPVDAKVDSLAAAAEDLERLMDCQIATVQISEEYKNRAEEFILNYAPSPKTVNTEFLATLHDRFGDISILQRLFTTSERIKTELGSWAAEFYWSFAFAEAEARKTEARAERQAGKQKATVDQVDKEVQLLRQGADYVSSQEKKTKPTLSVPSVSPKLLELHTLLMNHFGSKTEGRCIVFVETRAAAKLLAEIFRRVGGEHLRVESLTGSGLGTYGDESLSFHKQVKILLDFKKGITNCLFATAVAEEGLDVPACNLVIRFDLYKSMIGYIQSRGRARHKNSKYYHMTERGNQDHYHHVTQCRNAAVQMRAWCSQLPQDRKLQSLDVDLPPDWTDQMVVASTKARLNLHNSLSVLAHFVDTLPRPDNIATLNAQYIVSRDMGKFICEVILPPGSPMERMTGKPFSRKSIAKRSAAFEICREIKRQGLIDDHLVSTYQKKLPEMRNARLALQSKKGTQYPSKLKPRLWLEGSGTLPTMVYVTVFDIEGELDRPHRPLGILTRAPLPSFLEFPLFLNNGNMALIVSRSVHVPIPCTGALLEQATRFSLIVFLDIYNKEFEEDAAKMPYWIVPIEKVSTAQTEAQYRIDTSTLDDLLTAPEDVWNPNMPEQSLKGRFLVDKWEGGRRVFTVRVDPDKAALDPVPKGVPPRRYMKSILDYSISLFKRARERLESEGSWNLTQPVLECEQVQYRRNLLAKPDITELTSARIWVCPEPFKFSKLSAKTATMALIFPGIIHRIEDYLIALEAGNIVGLKLDSHLALEAMTKDSDNSDEATEEKINFRPGMGHNYERLEFIGDTFLKMATSLSLYGQKPNDDEWAFHVSRMCMLCNKNLFEVAKELKLYEYVRSLAFSRRTWYPPCIKMLKGKGAKDQDKTAKPMVHLGDKTVADVCEALIGAAFVQHSRPGKWDATQWDAAVKAVTVLVDSDDHRMLKWTDYLAAYQEPDWLKQQVPQIERDLAMKVEAIHPYHFKNPRLLRCAFNHPSYPASWSKMPSYQRIEFLGDSLLDVVCVSHLFYNYPDKDPQWLTEHKMAMVSNKFLSALCVKLGFHRFLRSLNDAVQRNVYDFVTEAEPAMQQAREGEVNWWMSLTRDVKCLSDIVESYIGAIFVDSGFDFAVVTDFFDAHFMPFFRDMTIYDTFANNHPTTRLHQILGAQFGCRDFKLMTQEVPQEDPLAAPKIVAVLMLHDKVVAHAVRESGGYAKSAVCRNALELFDGMFMFDFRRTYGCHCPAIDEEGAEQIELPNIGTAV